MPDSILYNISAIPEAQNGGLFVGQAGWIHPRRSIDSFEIILVRKGIVPINENGIDYRVEPGQLIVL